MSDHGSGGMIPAPSGNPRQAASAQLPGPLNGERKPDPALFKYYLLQSIMTGPFMVIFAPVRWFRYHTLRYVFDAEGVTMRWGILFRREISLTYARIQDIHLVSNLIERWLGLGRVQVQTASGNADAEMTIEGLRDFEAVRDELYRRMRGARGHTPSEAGSLVGGEPTGVAAAPDAVAALNEAVAELRALREELARQRGA